VGIETEWLTVRTDGAPERTTVATLRDLLRPAEPLPAGSRLSFEPGGQLELSTKPQPSFDEACRATAADLDRVRHILRTEGIELVGLGHDPTRPELRVNDDPRYEAMEAYFDLWGPAGRRMMCSSASIHVNIEAGPDGAMDSRWRLAHLLGPVLVGAFANSPLVAGRPSGWRSSRVAAWLQIDESRTAPADDGGSDPAEDWTRYALDARVMLIRAEQGYVPLDGGLPFGRWMSEGHELGFPTLDDLRYHLTTLFPPVRPRGWLELRMIDMVPDPWWRAAVATSSALLMDPEGARRATAAAAPASGLWEEAARSGLEHPAIARAARDCVEIAIETLERTRADATTLAVTSAYHDRYTARGRCPADDRLDEWVTSGRLLPTTTAEEETWTSR
jgi:glutamate--cysteine ligase